MQTHPLLIGKNKVGYLTFNGTEHVALHARTGTGKTSGFVIPNCFAWPGSLIVLDIKGECFEATAGYRADVLGQDVYLFNPTASDGCSHRFNPLSVIQRGSIKRFDQITRQTNLLLSEMPGESSNAARFWEPAARSAIAAVLALITETPGEPLTYANLLRILMRGDFHNWLVNQITQRRASGNPYSEQVILGVSDFLGGSEELVNAVRKTCTTNLQGFWNPTMAAATSVSDFDFLNIRRRPVTVYVAVAPSDIPRTRFLLRLLFDQVLNLNTDITPVQDPSLCVPILLLIDEFAQLDKMMTLAHAAQFARGFGIRVAYVIQDKAQLIALYGPAAARDIFSNLGIEIVFGTSDAEQARELENRMGDATVLFTTRNQPRLFGSIRLDKQHLAQHPHRRPVMLDQEILQMPDWMQLILRPGMKPARSERIRYYDDPNFVQWIMQPPFIPKLPIKIADDDGSIVIPLRGGARPQPPGLVPAVSPAAGNTGNVIAWSPGPVPPPP